MDALRELLGERDWHEIAVDDLARAAGISRPTFYFYFRSKEAVLSTLLEGLLPALDVAATTSPDRLRTDPRGAWRDAIAAALHLWRDHRDVLRAAAEARRGDPAVAALWQGVLGFFVDRTAEVIAAERARGAAAPGLPARELAVCLNRMNERLFESMVADEPLTLAPDGALDALVEVWVRAIYGTLPPPLQLEGP